MTKKKKPGPKTLSDAERKHLADKARERAEARWTPERKARLIELRAVRKWGYKAIAEDLKIARSSACKCYKKYSGDYQKHALRAWSQERIDQLIRMRDVDKLSFMKISKVLGCSSSSCQYQYYKYRPEKRPGKK